MRQFKITVNGKAYDVQVEENGVATAPVAAPLAATAPAATPAPAPAPAAAPVAEPVSAPAAAAGEGEEISAPMPGTILKVLVSAGQAIKAGEPVVILEAMKMENEISSPVDGTVTAVCVNQGDSVDAGKVIATVK